MIRLKSIGAIHRCEFVPRDPWRSNELSRCMPRWQRSQRAYSRRYRQRTSGERFPAGVAGGGEADTAATL